MAGETATYEAKVDNLPIQKAGENEAQICNTGDQVQLSEEEAAPYLHNGQIEKVE